MKFAESHEWINIEGEEGVVGITTHAQNQLGEIVYVQLPEKGTRVTAGEEVAVLESTKAAIDIYAPVSGEVIAVNHALTEDTEQLNQDPEGEGWLYKLKVSDPAPFNHLLSREQYLELILQ